jgi:NADH-quinone oxidoreductase subunit J
MMIDVKIEGLRVGFWNHFPLAALVGVVIALEMVAVLMGGFRATDSPDGANVVASGLSQTSNTKELGILMYTKYIYPLEVATAILLVAMIAAIALTLRTRKDTKYTNPSDQVRVKARNRMSVLKMKATSTATDQAPVASNVETKV